MSDFLTFVAGKGYTYSLNMCISNSNQVYSVHTCKKETILLHSCTKICVRVLVDAILIMPLGVQVFHTYGYDFVFVPLP